MKISQTGSGAPPSRRRKVSEGGDGTSSAAFAAHLRDETGATSGPSAASPLAMLSSLLAIQEMPDAAAGSRRAIARGDSLLDELKALQIGMVEGWVSEDTLRGLARMLDQPRPKVDDPELQQLLEAIELRASVELAKLETGDS